MRMPSNSRSPSSLSHAMTHSKNGNHTGNVPPIQILLDQRLLSVRQLVAIFWEGIEFRIQTDGLDDVKRSHVVSRGLIRINQIPKSGIFDACPGECWVNYKDCVRSDVTCHIEREHGITDPRRRPRVSEIRAQTQSGSEDAPHGRCCMAKVEDHTCPSRVGCHLGSKAEHRRSRGSLDNIWKN